MSRALHLLCIAPGSGSGLSARGPGEPRSLLYLQAPASPKAQCVHTNRAMRRRRG